MEDGNFEQSRFQTLRGLGKVISALGWIAVAGGSIVFLMAIVAATSGAVGRNATGLGLIIAGGPGFLVALFGILVVAAGQTVSCFVSIEENTHATLQAQKAVVRALGGTTKPPFDKGTQESAHGVSPSRISTADQAPKKVVACPKCAETESVNNRYDASQYKKFDAVDKSGFGFQSMSLTCGKCGCVFRV